MRCLAKGRIRRDPNLRSRRPTNFVRGLHEAADSSVVDNAQSDEVPHDVTSFRKRRGPFQSLPLPPLLDPIRLAAKQRYRLPKARFPEQEPTCFQEELRRNPYAEALATPVRACGPTNVRLPSFFHIGYNVVEHPETHRPWLVPKPSLSQKLYPDVDGSDAEAPSEGPSRLINMGEYVLARRPLLRYMSVGSHWQRMLSKTTRDKLKRRTRNMVWRRDMDDFVLDMLRRAAVTKLKWLFNHVGADLVTEISSVQEALPSDITCILVNAPFETAMVREAQNTLQAIEREARDVSQSMNSVLRSISKRAGAAVDDGGQVVSRRESIQRDSGAVTATARVTLPTVVWCNREVPIYSLPDLLGAKNTTELLTDTHFSSCLHLGLQNSRRTVGAQMALMKLQHYVVEVA